MNETKKLNAINVRLDALVDKIAKDNADNLKAICEISTILQEIEKEIENISCLSRK